MTRKKKGYQKTNQESLSDIARQICEVSFVKSVSEHFAGYFNELGISIELEESTKDSQIILLRNKLLKAFSSYGEENQLDFTWQISFTSNCNIIEVVFPDDSEKDIYEVLDRNS